MVSNKVFILVGAILATCLVASEGFVTHSEKCKYNMDEMAKQMPDILECCGHTLDKTCEAKTLMEDMANVNEEQDDKMYKCFGEKRGVYTHDGKFIVEKAKETLNGFILDDHTKAAIESKIEECAAEHNHDGDATRKCVRKEAEEICED